MTNYKGIGRVSGQIPNYFNHQNGGIAMMATSSQPSQNDKTFEVRPLGRLLRDRLHPLAFERVWYRLLPLYRNITMNQFYLQKPNQISGGRASAQSALMPFIDKQVSEIVYHSLKNPGPRPHWMRRLTNYRTLVLKTIGENIGIKFKDAIDGALSESHIHISDNIRTMADQILGLNKQHGGYRDYGTDGVLVRAMDLLRRNISNSIMSALYIDKTINPDFTLEGTIWEDIVRGEQHLLYTYICCALSNTSETEEMAVRMEDLVEYSYKAIPIGQTPKVTDVWAILFWDT